MNKTQLKKMGAHVNDCISANTMEELEQIINDAKTRRDQEDTFLAYQVTFLDEMRSVLKDIYDETEEEADRYSNKQVAVTYKNLWLQMFNHKKYIFANA